MKAESTLPHSASRTIAFRVSEEDYAKIQMMADISGKIKQDFIRERVLTGNVTIIPNSRVRMFLEKYLRDLTSELERTKSPNETDGGVIDRISLLLELISRL